MPTMTDLRGQRFGRLVVLSLLEKRSKAGGLRWLCRCDCGKEAEVESKNLIGDRTKSCGCIHAERMSTKPTRLTHGHSQKKTSATYKSWRHMRELCTNPKDISFANYGNRGITVCERWSKFENFLADMGERPKGMSIDRRESDGPYEPGNCRWATRTDQNNNTKKNVFVEYLGERMTLAQLSARFKIPYKTLYQRYASGWRIDLLVKPIDVLRRRR